jgi:hypothetical protein
MLYAVSYRSGEEDAAKMTHMHFGHAQYLPIALPLFALLAGALLLAKRIGDWFGNAGSLPHRFWEARTLPASKPKH